jgi:phospholipase C
MNFLRNIMFAVSLMISCQSFAMKGAGKFFDRAIIVIFENTNYSDAIKQPYFAQYAKAGAHFTNIFGITHPSQPNYIGLTSGSLHGVVNSSVIDLDVKNITDLLEAKNLTWKVYIEDFPGNCFTGATSGLYERRHNPFISYVNIQKNPDRCSHLVNAIQFEADAASGRLPHYSFYIPHNKNSGHNTGVAYADGWFGKFFGRYTEDSEFMKNTVLITTFDESGSLASNQIYTSVVGPDVKPGEYSEKLDLFSIFNLLELNWDLGNFGKEDATATPIPNIWR